MKQCEFHVFMVENVNELARLLPSELGCTALGWCDL